MVATLARELVRSILTALTVYKLLRYELSKPRIEKCYAQQKRNIDRASESRKTRREACVANLAEMKNIFRVLIGNRQGKKIFCSRIRATCVGFSVNKAAMGQVFLRVLPFFLSLSFHQCSIFIHLSFESKTMAALVEGRGQPTYTGTHPHSMQRQFKPTACR